MDFQKHVLYITRIRFERLNASNIRGVTAQWKEEKNTLCISIYFNGEPSDELKEDVTAICGEIIATFDNALMEENYIRCDYPKSLPDQEFIAYFRE